MCKVDDVIRMLEGRLEFNDKLMCDALKLSEKGLGSSSYINQRTAVWAESNNSLELARRIKEE